MTETAALSHAMLKRMGIGSSLWSVAHGLARSVERYKGLLAAADEPRKNELDGRGALSARALLDFCEYFLSTSVDQVEYMRSTLEPQELLRRIEIYVDEEVRAERLPKGTDVSKRNRGAKPPRLRSDEFLKDSECCRLLQISP